MTALLDQMDRLPTLVWAVVVMASCWLLIGAGAAVEYFVISSL